MAQRTILCLNGPNLNMRVDGQNVKALPWLFNGNLMNEQGIDECAKVANWQPGGGAPRTPAK